jgi:hypothetical protein
MSLRYPPRWKKRPDQNDDPEDRGHEKHEHAQAKEWVNPNGDGKEKNP